MKGRHSFPTSSANRVRLTTDENFRIRLPVEIWTAVVAEGRNHVFIGKGVDDVITLSLPSQMAKTTILREGWNHVVLCPGRHGHILLYSPGSFDRAIRGILPESTGHRTQKELAAIRAFLGGATKCCPDKKGRITLHPYLWDFAPQPKQISLEIRGV